MYLFNINGVVLAHVAINHTTPVTGSDFLGISPATVGVAIPTPEWLEGVEAVTGHEGGLVCLWKLRRVVTHIEGPPDTDTNGETRGLQIQTDGLTDSILDPDCVSHGSNRQCESRLHRELYVCSTIAATHLYDITAVKLCRTSVHHSSVIPNPHSGSTNAGGVATIASRRHHYEMISNNPVTDYTGSGFDLLVGDSHGFVSRWASVRPHSEKQK